MEAIDLEFRELQIRAKAEGLFEKTYGFHIGQAVMILALCAASLCMLVFMEGFWLRIVINAVFLAAFASAHAGFLMHEVVHQQVLKYSGWYVAVCACIDAFLGSNSGWWENKHNIGHHLNPNAPEKDPDVSKIAFMAFTREQALVKRGLCRFTTRHQHWLLPFLLLFQPEHMRFAAAQWLCKQTPARAIAGFSLMGLHLVVYCGVLLSYLSLSDAAIFMFLHNGSLGLYLGMAFAVNHIGMRMLKSGEQLSYFEQQVLTARNIGGGWLTTFILGGLNFQIEHHLFPEISTPRLPKFAELVKELCEKEGVTYHSVSFWKGCKEVYLHLRNVARYAA